MEGKRSDQLDFFDRTGRQPETITKTTAQPGKAGADTKDQAEPRATRIDFRGLYGKPPKPSETARAKPRSQRE